MDWYYPYIMSPQVPNPVGFMNTSDHVAPFVPKPLSKEARMALKRKRKGIKKSRNKNR